MKTGLTPTPTVTKGTYTIILNPACMSILMETAWMMTATSSTATMTRL